MGLPRTRSHKSDLLGFVVKNEGDGTPVFLSFCNSLLKSRPRNTPHGFGFPKREAVQLARIHRHPYTNFAAVSRVAFTVPISRCRLAQRHFEATWMRNPPFVRVIDRSEHRRIAEFRTFRTFHLVLPVLDDILSTEGTAETCLAGECTPGALSLRSVVQSERESDLRDLSSRLS